MSRHIPGIQYTGPPGSNIPSLSTSSVPLHQRLRPNNHGLTARERENQLLKYTFSSDKKALEDEIKNRKNDWDVVRDHHQFIRNDNEQNTREGEASGSGWEEKVARAYESKLFKEFAMIDLKHYKSKKFALRWRTAPEVINGLGEETCGSLRCKNHHHQQQQQHSDSFSPSRQITFAKEKEEESENDDDGSRKRKRVKEVSLKSFELPFVYSERGQRKEALVKVRLCQKCQKKLLWKPTDEDKNTETGQRDHREGEDREKHSHRRARDEQGRDESYRRDKNRRLSSSSSRSRSRSQSRSRSPRRKRKSYRHD